MKKQLLDGAEIVFASGGGEARDCLKASCRFKRQAQPLSLSRSSLYQKLRPVRQDSLALMRRIDVLHFELPCTGSQLLRDLLAPEGPWTGQRCFRRLIRIMGLEATLREKNTSA